MKSMGNQEDKLTFDDVDETSTVKLYYALMRKKENPGVTRPLVMRQIIHNKDVDLAVLMTRIQSIPGVWRLYETVNARDVKKARQALLIELIKDTAGKFDHRIDSLWKTCLMQPENKAENLFVLDIDTKNDDEIDHITRILDAAHAVYEKRETVNGYHIRTTKFDTRLLKDVPNVEIKRDALFFIRLVDTRAST